MKRIFLLDKRVCSPLWTQPKTLPKALMKFSYLSDISLFMFRPFYLENQDHSNLAGLITVGGPVNSLVAFSDTSLNLASTGTLIILTREIIDCVTIGRTFVDITELE